MNKNKVIEFFDSLAPEWDEREVRNESRINKILDIARVGEDVKILDVACGTGVLFPDYTMRKVGKIVGVDIAPKMIECASAKFSANSNIELLCADIEELQFDEFFDVCMIYNAIPHFECPARLLAHLSRFIKVGGQLTVAHGMSRAQIDKCHEGRAKHVSKGLLHAEEMAKLFAPYFKVCTCISDDEIYVVSGTRVEI